MWSGAPLSSGTATKRSGCGCGLGQSRLLPAYSLVPGTLALVRSPEFVRVSLVLGKAVSPAMLTDPRQTLRHEVRAEHPDRLQLPDQPNDTSKAGAIQQDNTLFKATTNIRDIRIFYLLT